MQTEWSDDINEAYYLIHRSSELLRGLEQTFARRIITPERDLIAGCLLDSALVGAEFMKAPVDGHGGDAVARMVLGFHMRACLATQQSLLAQGRGTRGASSVKKELAIAAVALQNHLARNPERRSRASATAIERNRIRRRANDLPVEVLESIIFHLAATEAIAPDVLARDQSPGRLERLRWRSINANVVSASRVGRLWYHAACRLVWTRALPDSRQRLHGFLLASMLSSMDLSRVMQSLSVVTQNLCMPVEAAMQCLSSLDLLDVKLEEPKDSTLLRALGDRAVGVTTMRIFVTQLRWITLQHIVLCAPRLQSFSLRGSIEPAHRTTTMTRLRTALSRLHSLDLDFSEASQTLGDVRNKSIAAATWIFSCVGGPGFVSINFTACMRLSHDLVVPFLSRCSTGSKSLHTIALDHTVLIPEVYLQLAKVNLRSLCLTNSLVGDEDLASIADGCQNLHVLNISRSEVTGAGLVACGRLRKLRQLYIDDIPLRPASCIGDIFNTSKDHGEIDDGGALGQRLEVLSAHNCFLTSDHLNLVLSAVVRHCRGPTLRRLDLFGVGIWGKDLRGASFDRDLLESLLEECVGLRDLIIDIFAVADDKLCASLAARFPMMHEDALLARNEVLGVDIGGSGSTRRFWVEEHGWI